ncbi:hypothetical protein F751_1447 [Auxenochlorella protothecoides]|uniref:Uncharacterized protein n=1 Tax=Auxenochlorella protothecoides TaxID=3075 RepID=A0A087SJC9_AUXPR|nr:hypothetical protein F751_1447 [Auxenochlorella protothecoides]KFM25833.1 hypothetical protein F751_1447 [Auxenochlorella protothecoides]
MRTVPPSPTHLAAGLVDGNHVASSDLLLLYRLDHLRAEIVDGLHLRRLHRELAL